MGLTQKILLFTGGLVVALVAITVSYTSVEANRLAFRNIDRTLTDARTFWDGFQADQYAKLKLGLGVLANDPAFKAAVQVGQPATVKDMLEERGRDLGADFFIATDAQGRVVGRSDTPLSRPEDLSRDPVVRAPLEGAVSASELWRREGQLFQAVSVPLRIGKMLVGVLVAGYEIKDSLATQIERLTHSQVAFLAITPDQGVVVSATSIGIDPTTLGKVLKSRPFFDARGPTTAPFDIDLGGEHQVAVQIPLKAKTGEVLGSMLIMRSLTSERAAFDQFRGSLVAVSLAVMLAGLLVAYLGASRITGPLSILVGVVERVREGTYTGAIDIRSSDEIGTLAVAFDRMREGIAAREEQIRRMALQDPLTGLPNRSLFHDRLEHALGLLERATSELAVLVLDLDRFKDVNDSLGHVAGDQVLREVALRLTEVLRSSDTVARLGGDEFAILLPSSGAEKATRVAIKVMSAVGEPLSIEGQTLHLATSIGIAIGRTHGNESEILLRAASRALGIAKKTDAGFAVYDPSDDRSESRLWLIEELRYAIEHDQLVLHYQPKARLSTGSVVQVEALVRWTHPERGLVAPDRFVPLAEQTGLIRLLTHWVLEEAIRQSGEWTRRGLTLEIAINISARDLLNPDLPNLIAGIMATHGVDPSNLRLEITESAIMEDPAQAMGILNRCKELGIKLSIDDFGTGYSSLSNLRKLPVDELKIDRSFVSGMPSEPDDTTIVHSTIDLGHNMGLEVVAEGVESQEVWDLLKALGCDLAQGNYLSCAVPREELEAWLLTRGPLLSQASGG